jgi:hypothetical protein
MTREIKSFYNKTNFYRKSYRDSGKKTIVQEKNPKVRKNKRLIKIRILFKL